MMAFSAPPPALTMNPCNGLKLEQHFDSKKPHFMELPECNPKTTTVADLKGMVSKLTGIPVEGQILYSGPVAMINNRLLSDYQHLARRPILLEPSLPGGCKCCDCLEDRVEKAHDCFENCGCECCAKTVGYCRGAIGLICCCDPGYYH